jgi:EmrB/QacA subfamily drug resistance transporter
MNSQTVNTPESGGGLAYKWRVLICAIFGIFMIILDTTVVNIAFRTLQEEFGASVNDSQWIISIYVLALGITIPVSGYLGDRFGIKNVFLGGLALFVVGSLLCGIAPNLPILILARAIQGIGGGLTMPLGPALLYPVFPPNEQGRAFGLFGVVLVTAPALGPILGGALVDNGLWRWIFFINLPIGLMGIWLGMRWLKPSPGNSTLPLDWLGLIFSTVGFGSVLYAATHAAESGWGSGEVLTFFAIGTVALIIFGIVELFIAKVPLLDLRLFQSSVFTSAAFVGWVSVMALFGAEFLLPLYMQVLRGYTAFETGLLILPLAIASAIATPIAGQLYDKIGPRPLVVVGFLLLVVNTWQMAQIQIDTPISWLVFLLAIRGLALGMTIQTTFTTALSTIPVDKVSRGSGLINSTRQVIQAISVAVLATVLTSHISPTVQAEMDQLQTQMAQFQTMIPANTEIPALCEIPNATLPIPANVKSTIGQFCEEYVIGLEQAYNLTFYFAIAAVFLGLLLPGWPASWVGRKGTAPGQAGPPVAAGH